MEFFIELPLTLGKLTISFQTRLALYVDNKLQFAEAYDQAETRFQSKKQLFDLPLRLMFRLGDLNFLWQIRPTILWQNQQTDFAAPENNEKKEEHLMEFITRLIAQLFPNSINFQINYALLLEQQGEIEAAYDYLQECMVSIERSKLNRSAIFWNNLGVYGMELFKKTEQAQHYTDQAKQYLLEAGQYLQIALGIDPESELIIANLQEVQALAANLGIILSQPPADPVRIRDDQPEPADLTDQDDLGEGLPDDDDGNNDSQ